MGFNKILIKLLLVAGAIGGILPPVVYTVTTSLINPNSVQSSSPNDENRLPSNENEKPDSGGEVIDPLPPVEEKIYWQDFMWSNSYKVQFKWEEAYDSTQNIVYTVSGTAWSWYYTYTNNEFVWYLMTNFHVTNDYVYYLANKNEDYLDIQSYRADNNEVTLFNYVSNRYNDLNIASVAKNIDVIVDNKTSPAANNNLNLFSNDTFATDRYNLDMSLIKITFNNNIDYTEQLKENNIQNPYQVWINNNANGKNNINNEFNYNNEERTIIGGNPASENRLIIKYLTTNWVEKYGNLKIEASDVPGTNLLKLCAPYIYSDTYYPSWNLTGGASGSAAYQISDRNNSFNANLLWTTEMLPVGIYWGASVLTSASSERSAPSIIPFVHNNENTSYNIFDNFRVYLKANG